MNKSVILTGLRANSEFHLGNYLGAILPVVDLQEKHAGQYQINMFIPDLHSLTTPIDHGALYQQTINNLKVFVAAGLDINNGDTYIYRQSYIPAHSELTWILSCFSYFGELSRMTQFKDKSAQLSNDPNTDTAISAGLFIYPVLMAADILLYGAEYVPVGEDQRQHIELTRDLAIRFNNKFGSTFVVPQEWEKQLAFTNISRGIRIRSLRNPDKKMSKSIDDPAGTILLSDVPDEAESKVMAATTDSLNQVNYDWEKQPGVTNLLQILSLLTNTSQDDINSRWVGQTSYGELKKTVANEVKNFLTSVQGKLTTVDEDILISKLQKDEQAMNAVASETLRKVQKVVGLRP